MWANFLSKFHLPVAWNGLKRTVISTEWDVESNHSLAGLDELEVLLVDASLISGLVVEEFDLLEETWLVVCIEFWTKLLGALGCSAELGGRYNRLGIGVRFKFRIIRQVRLLEIGLTSCENGWVGSLGNLGKSLHDCVDFICFV